MMPRTLVFCCLIVVTISIGRTQLLRSIQERSGANPLQTRTVCVKMRCCGWNEIVGSDCFYNGKRFKIHTSITVIQRGCKISCTCHEKKRTSCRLITCRRRGGYHSQTYGSNWYENEPYGSGGSGWNQNSLYSPRDRGFNG